MSPEEWNREGWRSIYIIRDITKAWKKKFDGKQPTDTAFLTDFMKIIAN